MNGRQSTIRREKIPKPMKRFFREHKLSKNSAKRWLGILHHEEMAGPQRTQAIIGYNAIEQSVWSARLRPPNERYEVAAADIFALREYCGFQIGHTHVKRAQGG